MHLQPRAEALRYIMILALLPIAAMASSSPRSDSFDSMYSDRTPFLNAIELERPTIDLKLKPTGITTPHHLTAIDLIARAFWTAANNSYSRIVILSPDHFQRSHHVIATTRLSFRTVFGTVPTDGKAAEKLLEYVDLAEDSDLFEKEHGIGALLPFVRFFFPDTPIVPVALSVGSTPAEWQAAADAISAIVTPETLIVQSTDFSHYLSAQEATARDQETLNVISEGDPSKVSGLRQSQHLDSKASQYVQSALQASVFHSHATIIANRNQVEYNPLASSTTSYIVAVFTPTASDTAALRYRDQHVFYFGGDFFPGRWLAAPLNRSNNDTFIVNMIRKLTGGGPIIVNLEGVMMEDPPPGLPSDLHVFHSEMAGSLLNRLNVSAASLANNHSFDLGLKGIKETITSLQKLNVAPLEHMKAVDFGAFRLIALNFIGLRAFGHYPVVRDGDLERICRMAIKPPVVAFVHWGEEFTSKATATTIGYAEALHNCGISLIVGAHSHQASPQATSMWGGEFAMIYSLGNLLFDQRSTNTSGSVLELRFFSQGTFASRLIPAPNLFELIEPRDQAN